MFEAVNNPCLVAFNGEFSLSEAGTHAGMFRTGVVTKRGLKPLLILSGSHLVAWM